MIREVIGTSVIIFLNNLGLLLAMNTVGFLRVIGYLDYISSSLVLYFIITKYCASDYFKNLGKEKEVSKVK